MEYIEIIFGGIKSSEIDRFIKDILQIKEQGMISSHFYSDAEGDFEYSDDLSLKNFFSIVNTANLFVKNLRIVQEYHEIMCVISSDQNDIEVTCNFSAEQFHKEQADEIESWFQQLCSEGITAFASLGYECEAAPIIIVRK